MIRILALFVTLTAACMAAVAAWDRGGTVIDRALLVSLSVVIVLAVHLIPALSRRPVAWAVWSVCLLCAVFGHLTFLTHASLRAADLRSQDSAATLGTERQILAAREALAAVEARPLATVAAALAQSDDRRMRSALRVELAEAKRAAALRDALARLEAEATAARVTGASDPVTARLAAVTGWSESGVSVAVGMTFALIVELFGALLWFEALRVRDTPLLPASISDAPDGDSVTEVGNEAVTASITEQVTAVSEAIKSGNCGAKVADIRKFLGCGQARAAEVRRVIMGGVTA